MTDVYAPPQLKLKSHVSSLAEYQKLYSESIAKPSSFWEKIASDFYWKSAPSSDNIFSANFNVNEGPIDIKWFKNRLTNICYNVLDRHVENGLGSKVAFYWEGNEPTDSTIITYEQLLQDVKKFANVLKSFELIKGDRVAIYMPMIPQLLTAMLACTRIGVIHSIIFGGFSSESLAERILDCSARLLITCDGVYRGAKPIHLKDIADDAIDICSKRGLDLRSCIVVRHLCSFEDSSHDLLKLSRSKHDEFKINWNEKRDHWWEDVMKSQSESDCPVVWVDGEDDCFMLYTSGSTGKPKGVIHTTAGYLIYVATTFKYVFDYQPGDVYFCTADIGWITGHSYITYGPMANAATSVMFEGVPLHPDPGRFWAIVEKYKVNQFYTAPTAIRLLMKYNHDIVAKYDRSSLRILGTVGEPINPAAWQWYYTVVGDSRCAIVDTYWQTETGGHIITNLPAAVPMKPGFASLPFFGIEPALLDDDGKEVEGVGEGFLVVKKSWPGMMRTIYKNHSRFESTYFKRFPGYYMTGDRAKRDGDGYYCVIGRCDDMINVSGHLLSTAEVESALVCHAKVCESAVVSREHDITGECLYCFVTLRQNETFSDDLVEELKNLVKQKIGSIATPKFIQNAQALPKTRSGKIMRRVLRKIARCEEDEIGDTSTLSDPSVVENLIALRPKFS